MKEPLHSAIVPSLFGSLQIVWREAAGRPRVCRILLPREGPRPGGAAPEAATDIGAVPCAAIRSLGGQIQRFLRGEPVAFDMGLIDLGECYAFQRRVLLVEREIPRGWVSTYGRIASRLGAPGAARAVGTALARNPFPLIIACHRTIRSDGTLGGFGGGVEMKRALLELEGVEFSQMGKVLGSRFYY
ncbi:MAG: methylated-DNA--[protein]-cysteine S-methyltransferase [Dehalococcoidia bacterium]|nr:methylated-DNA--[protein]-cysteine S-methyltransferase [Dehalococcoidia bacterium]